jgi:poly-gamma-glutamate synthesis protein (capsule biosynthesis protein)
MRTLTLILAASLAASGCSLLGSGEDEPSGPAGRTFTVAAGGDILSHPQLTAQAAKDGGGKVDHDNRATGNLDYDKIMGGIQPAVSKADLAICHMEPVLGQPGGPFEGFPDFELPPQIAKTIKKIGYDTCSTASNHSLDHGAGGVRNTLDVLDKAGLKHTGSARSAAEAAKPLILDVKGVKVAHLSYAYGFNRREVPADKPWLANTTSLEAIIAAEKKARAAGAEVVLLSLHWGHEHRPEPSKGQLNMARKIVARTGINLVIGHHAHVVQPMEKIDGTWVAFGLGNQLARHDVPSGLTEEGALGWFTFTERGGKWEVKPSYVPTFVQIPSDSDPEGDHRLVDVVRSLREDKGLSAAERARLKLAFERTEGTMLNRGAEADGLRPLHELP